MSQEDEEDSDSEDEEVFDARSQWRKSMKKVVNYNKFIDIVSCVEKRQKPQVLQPIHVTNRSRLQSRGTGGIHSCDVKSEQC